MLLELRADNYTVIDSAQVEFGPGLNLLTGETGAGKSILIDALVLLLGGKASADVVRHGEEKATLACVFEATPGAESVLEANGIDAEEDTILLRREITAAGKGRVFVNNQAATVAVLRQLAPELALVHGQAETTASFDAAQQRALLDRFGKSDSKSDSGAEPEAVRSAFSAWGESSRRLRELETSAADRLRMADLWRFQSAEIAEQGITGAEEDAQLEAEKRLLSNAERLRNAAMTAHQHLYEAEQSAETTLGLALRQIEELARFEPRFADAVQQLAGAKAIVEDIDASVRSFAESVGGQPERLAEIEDRLAALDRLKRKYGPTLGEVIVFGAESALKLAEVENHHELLVGLRAEQQQRAAAYRSAASALSAVRLAAAKRLQPLAETQINELAMKVRFAIEVRAKENDERLWTAAGWDEVEFLIAT